MPETNTPLKTRPGSQTAAKKTRKAAATAKAPVAETDAAEPPTDSETVDETAEPTDPPESLETTTVEGDSTAAETPQPTAAAPVDSFDYNQSTLTLSLSFLRLVEGAAGRQVIVSVHSKNGTGKSVLPEFMAPLQESDLRLPKSVLELIERYRTVTLPKRKADAERKAAELAAKRPVTQSKKGKEVRPQHITASTTKRTQTASSVTQFKLSFKGANK